MTERKIGLVKHLKMYDIIQLHNPPNFSACFFSSQKSWQLWWDFLHNNVRWCSTGKMWQQLHTASTFAVWAKAKGFWIFSKMKRKWKLGISDIYHATSMTLMSSFRATVLCLKYVLFKGSWRCLNMIYRRHTSHSNTFGNNQGENTITFRIMVESFWALQFGKQIQIRKPISVINVTIFLVEAQNLPLGQYSLSIYCGNQFLGKTGPCWRMLLAYRCWPFTSSQCLLKPFVPKFKTWLHKESVNSPINAKVLFTYIVLEFLELETWNLNSEIII